MRKCAKYILIKSVKIAVEYIDDSIKCAPHIFDNET